MKIPKEIWQCIDCRTLSDSETSHKFHTTHVGIRYKPNELFVERKDVFTKPNGEIIWIDKPGFVNGFPIEQVINNETSRMDS